jgi:Flp pilus assembly protein TadD
VNYIIASSDVISALGVVASFAVYFLFPRQRRYFLFVLPAAICILAKPPAIVFPVLFAFYRLLFPTPNEDGNRSRTGKWEILPPFLICAAMLAFVQSMTPRSWVAGAMDSFGYLITQPYVVLEYFRTFLWPSQLSADYDLGPFSSLRDAHFWTGAAFATLLIAAAIGFSFFKRTRVIGFGLLWFLVGLLPTSLFPLAEVMNDHRTFLPYLGLVTALAGVASLWIERLKQPITLVSQAATAVIGLLLVTGAYATFQRNKVWQSEQTLWRDVTLKSPRNGRGLMNYGLTLMAEAKYSEALDYFHRAEVFTPHYPILFVNLGIAENAIGQADAAEQHFKDALRLAPGTPDVYTFYAHFLIQHERQAEAQPLLRKAAELSPHDEMIRDLTTEASVFSAETYLNQSLQFYREHKFADSLTAAQKALELRPGYAQAWNNIAAAYNDLGQFEKAASACEEALRLKPDFELARNNLRYAQEKLNQAKAGGQK